jgi:hypothetical protein
MSLSMNDREHLGHPADSSPREDAIMSMSNLDEHKLYFCMGSASRYYEGLNLKGFGSS